MVRLFMCIVLHFLGPPLLGGAVAGDDAAALSGLGVLLGRSSLQREQGVEADNPLSSPSEGGKLLGTLRRT